MKKNIGKRLKSNKGITLVALVVTIIVLLILAAVSLSAVFSERGVYSRAELATIKDENGKVYENLRLHTQNIQLDKAEAGTYSLDMFDEFIQKQYINENGIVNMAQISSSKMKTGLGSQENGDVYVVKQLEGETTGDYYLFYYNNKNEEQKIGKLFTKEIKDYFTYELNEETKTATVTGVKEEFLVKSYYERICRNLLYKRQR